MDYEKVFEDLANVELDYRYYTLVFDADGGYWRYTGPVPDGLSPKEQHEFRAEKAEEARKKYGTPGGYSDIVDLANAAGLPAEWC